MKMKNMKTLKKMNLICNITILMVLLITGCSNGKKDSSNETFSLKEESENTSNSSESITLREIQQELETYLKTNHPELQLGTDEFFEFANKQLIENADSKLAEMEHYAFIHSYLAEYVNEYFDYMICKDALKNGTSTEELTKLCRDSKCVKCEHDGQSTVVKFTITDEFLDQTIADLIEKNKESETN